MRYLLLIIVLLVASPAMADPILVHHNQDGTISVEYFNWALYKGLNSPVAKAVWMKANSRDYAPATSDVSDTAFLPVRYENGLNVRYKWRGAVGQPITINRTIK